MMPDTGGGTGLQNVSTVSTVIKFNFASFRVSEPQQRNQLSRRSTGHSLPVCEMSEREMSESEMSESENYEHTSDPPCENKQTVNTISQSYHH
jgi:hypothetical protein